MNSVVSTYLESKSPMILCDGRETRPRWNGHAPPGTRSGASLDRRPEICQL